jgi:hypothetical protein
MNFIEHYVKELNQCRTNPASFANVIEHHMQFIEPNEDNNSRHAAFYVREGMPKIALTRGVPAFQELADRLRNMEPMGKIELRQDLSVAIPDQSKWSSKEHMAHALKQVKVQNKQTHKYRNMNFHFDIGSPWSENSFVLQLVDDSPFKGTRSRNILNPDFTYVGITSEKVKNKHCGYYLFAC